MEYVVLGLLMIEDMTIYLLKKNFSGNISLFYSDSMGGIQAAIKVLLGKGSITFKDTVEKGRKKKIYSITDSGRKAFYEWMWEDIPENKLEEGVLSRVYFLGLLKDFEKKSVLEKIIQQVKSSEEFLAYKEKELAELELPEDYEKLFGFQFSTLKYGLLQHRTALKWLKDLYKTI